jgi:hypothetical protein
MRALDGQLSRAAALPDVPGTAVAPDFVFTVRTYGTSPLYGPPLVRKFSSRKRQTSRSQPCAAADRLDLS